MVGQLLHSDPLLRIHLQALLEHLDAGLAHCLFDQRIYLVISALDGFDDLVVAASLEGQLPMQHAVQDHSGGPDINPPVDFVVLLVEEALRRHVGKTPSIQILLLEEGDCSSDTKIDDFDFLLLRVDKQHVF